MQKDNGFGKGKNTFYKKLAFIGIFFLITPIALLTSAFSLYVVSQNDSTEILGTSTKEPTQRGVRVYAALPEETSEISANIIAEDARPELIRNYLKKYNSPMLPHADFIVKTADKYGVDYRLTTAIAMKESGLGKRMPHDDCNNAWGYGIHSEGTLCFDTWEKGIETVTKGIKDNYIDLGYDTPQEMMQKYTPLSKGTWAEGVIYYMSQLQ